MELSERYLSRMYRRYYPFVPDHAEGDTVYTIEGEAYIDLYAGVSIVNVGWSDDRVIDAVEKQLQKMFHISSSYYLEHTAKLAKKLADLSPYGALTKSFFTNSGSESVETAISVARRVSRRPYIMSLHRSFHGRTFYAMSALGQSQWKVGLGPFAPVVFAPEPYCYRCPMGQKQPPDCAYACVKYMEDVIRCEVGGESIAALLAEPMLANGGMIVPPTDYFREVKQLLDKYGMLFIADEVQSGNGRTGKLWAIEHYGVAPDVMTTSKAIANGLPLGVTMISEKVDSGLKPGEHYSTLGGNALSCAAAMVVLDELTTGLIETARENGAYFKRRLLELMDKHEVVGDVRGEGFFLGMELVKDRATKAPAREEAARLLQETFKKKMLIGLGGLDGNVVRIEPPLVLTKEHIDRSIVIFDEALRACRGGP